VHGIPAEVLAEIFLLVRDGSTASSASTTSAHDQVHTGNLALIRITAVCLRWRLVATDLSVLWSNIAFSTLKTSSVQCAELFLGRTKRCTICIYISAPVLLNAPTALPLVHKLFLKISSESHRIRVFDFLATPRTSALYGYWTNLTINPHRIPEIGETVPLGHSVFPLAESMRLSSPSWYPGVAPCLKNLDLRNDNNTASITSLLHALEGCPALESLTLQGYRQFIDEHSPNTPVTTLPKLHRLHFFFCNSAPILASLRLPSLTHPLAIFDSDPHEDLLHYLPQRQLGAPYLDGVSKLRVVLNIGNSQYSVSAYREDGRTNFCLGVSSVSHLFRWQWIRESMETITSFDPFSGVTSLSISTDVIFASWSSWLSRLHHLSRLDLCCPDVTSYLDTLSTSVDGSPLCPSLRTLALRGSHPSIRLNYELLKACILFRRAVGCPLTLVLVPEDEWVQARAYDVSWDALVNSQSKLFTIRDTRIP